MRSTRAGVMTGVIGLALLSSLVLVWRCCTASDPLPTILLGPGAGSDPATRTAAATAAPLPSDGREATSSARCIVALPASASDPDLEWLDLSRERRDFVSGLVLQPETADPSRLLRSTTFNPRDVWLPMTVRDQVAAAIAQVAADAKVRAIEHETVRAREFAAARDNGRTVAVDLDDDVSRLRLAQLGSGLQFCTAEGTMFAVQQQHLPGTCRAAQRRRDLGLELLLNLADTFAGAGALTGAEVASLTAKARLLATNVD